jgi:hypothetical protein
MSIAMKPPVQFQSLLRGVLNGIGPAICPTRTGRTEPDWMRSFKPLEE